MKMVHLSVSIISRTNPSPCSNISVNVRLPYSAYIHHTVLMDMDSTKHASGGFCVGERALSMPGGEFIGWGQESNEDGIWMFTTQDGRLNSGWFRSPSASMLATGELVNYRNSTKRIYMDLDIEYVQVFPALMNRGSFD